VYIRAIIDNFSQTFHPKSLVVELSSNISDVHEMARVIFELFWMVILIVSILECANGSTEISESREFGLDIVGNSLGIVASTIALIGQGTKFGGLLKFFKFLIFFIKIF
jgi:hypothetical protein